MPSKEKMLHACIAKQQSLISDFKRGIRELVENRSGDEVEDQPGSAEEMALQRRQLNDQVSFASEELKTLEDMFPTCNERHHAVRLGSAVVTDKKIFYVSVSIERFEVEGKQIFGISQKSPLYRKMSGKTQGDFFAFGGETYKIVEVY